MDTGSAFIGEGLAKGGYDTIRLRKKWQAEHPEGDVPFTEWLKQNKIKLPNMPEDTAVKG